VSVGGTEVAVGAAVGSSVSAGGWEVGVADGSALGVRVAVGAGGVGVFDGSSSSSSSVGDGCAVNVAVGGTVPGVALLVGGAVFVALLVGSGDGTNGDGTATV
jgi:hypothetical protein